MIKIKPPNPIEGDNISAKVSNVAGPCFITSSSPPSKLINNNPVFTLLLDCTGIVSFLPAPYPREFQLGSLPAGDYTIVHSVINGAFPVLEQVSLRVTAVKDVPAVSPLGLILLSTLLLIVGKRYLKRRLPN